MATKVDSTQIIFDEQSSAPATPATGKTTIYVKTDGNVYQKTDAGVETQLGGGGGSGTVTSVGLSAPSDLLTVSGSPVTTADTLVLAKPTSTAANTVYAAPNGAPGAAAFRALLAADIPSLDAAKTTSGTFDIARIPTITAAKGGTGQTSYTAGDLLYATGATTLAKLGIGSTGQVLTVSGGLPAWAAGGSSSIAYAELRHQQNQNVAGQTGITAGSWVTLTLNTETTDPSSIVSIGSNQFTPVSGTYMAMVEVSFSVAGSGDRVAFRLHNATTATQVTRGVNSRAVNNSSTEIPTYQFTAAFAANGTDAYAIQAFFKNSSGSIDQRMDSATVGVEIYMRVMLFKIA